LSDDLLRDALRSRLLKRMGPAVQHDLKSPVQGLYWSLELAMKGVAHAGCDEKSRSQVEKAVSMARKELARLERTSRGLLLDAGVMEDEASRFDLADLTREVTRHFVTEAAMREVQLTVTVPATPVFVHAPRSEISQALLACIVRSLDAVPARGVVEVTLHEEKDSAWVEVSDNAPQVEEPEESLGAMGLKVARETLESRGGGLKSACDEKTSRRSVCLRLPVSRDA